MTDEYEAVIGLEIHIELATETKIFCSCKTDFGAAPNTQICPVCMGLPGTLPTLNSKAVEYAIKAGLAVGCNIAEYTRFDRKNYFYPDLPKAYQISQNEYPICRDGKIEINTENGKKTVRIKRIHLEEDAGKLLHRADIGTLVDYNRCGVPLIEIVTEPDLRSAEEARLFLGELRTAILYTGISDCKMNEGSMRCDVNLSVRKKGTHLPGTRTEMKNINSVSFAAKAIEYEYSRQIQVLESGGQIVPETRRFDSKTGQTYAMRAKESSDDYRFFPEPDLRPLRISREYVKKIEKNMSVPPKQRRKTYTEKYMLSPTDAAILTSSPRLSDYFEAAAEATPYPKTAANIILSELLAEANADEFSPSLTSAQTAELATLYGNATVNSSTLKKLIKLLPSSDLCASELVEKNGLAQINDRQYISAVLDNVLSENPKLISDYLGGKSSVKKAIVGKAMAKTEGKANPKILDELLDGMLNL